MEPKNAKRRSNFRRANRIMPRRRIDIATEALDYKNPDLLQKFVTESGKILPRRLTGMPAHLHRKITREIKRARSVLLMKSRCLLFPWSGDLLSRRPPDGRLFQCLETGVQKWTLLLRSTIFRLDSKSRWSKATSVAGPVRIT